MLSILVPLALLISFVLTWKLWIGTRLYPMTPVISVPFLIFPFDYILFAILLLLLLCSVISWYFRNHTVYIICCSIILLLGLLDQMRWQPYIYQYLFMLGTLIFCFGKNKAFHTVSALHTCRIILASTYFWSGAQKLNVSFMDKTIYWLFDPPLFHNFLFLAPYIWFIFPLLEISIGAGLFFVRTRRTALIGAVSMHLFILFLLGILKHNLLYVVWVWNIYFALFTIVLFWDEKSDCKEIFSHKIYSYKTIVILLFTIMPVLGIFHIIDSNLSAAFYSGNLIEATLYLKEGALLQQPPEIRRHIQHDSSLDIRSWAYTDFGIYIYPELRIYKSIAKSFCGKQGDVQLYIENKPQLWSSKRSTDVFVCADLVHEKK